MEVVDVGPEHEGLFCICLEDREPAAEEAGPLRRQWYDRAKAGGLGAKVAVEGGRPVGMIQYLPSDQVLLEGGEGSFYVLCIWVPPFKDDRGNFRGRGVGKALLAAAEGDARARGATGMAAWGIRLPFWMRAAWFKRYGYRKVDRVGVAVLMWKPFREGVPPPRFVRRRRSPEPVPGKVTVTSLHHGWCMAMNLVHERARRAAADLGDRVAFQDVDTSDLAVAREWGETDALYVDGRPVSTGPPPSYEKLRRLIAKRVRRL
jgi:GNAT superfamily N-acetyltransferase